MKKHIGMIAGGSGTTPMLQVIEAVLKNPRGNSNWFYKLVHGHIIKSGFQADTFIANMVINSYSKSGQLGYARTLFDQMAERNISTWSSMISAYTQHGYCDEAWMMFLMFQRDCIETINEYFKNKAKWWLTNDGIFTVKKTQTKTRRFKDSRKGWSKRNCVE